MNWLAVAIGAVLGAWARWGVGTLMNPIHPHLPLGTLAVNIAGGFIIGIAVGFFSDASTLNPAWRHFVVTGFLGTLTTFSTFSAESFALMRKGEYLWVLGHSLLHLVGSIFFCIVGFICYRYFMST